MKSVFFLILLAVFIAPHCASAGLFERTLKIGGPTRDYSVYRPRGFQDGLPVLIALHGSGDDYDKFENQTELQAAAERYKFILVMPNSKYEAWQPNDFGQYGVHSDVLFLDVLMRDLINRDHIDPKRIYMAGYANGGFMAQTYACIGQQKLAGIAIVASGLEQELSRKCNPSPMDVLYVHGDADHLVPFKGGYYGTFIFLSTQASVDFWMQKDRCTTKQSLNLVSPDPEDLTTGVRSIYDGCLQKKKVTYFEINKGGHSWPGDRHKYSPDGNKISRVINTSFLIGAMIAGK